MYLTPSSVLLELLKGFSNARSFGRRNVNSVVQRCTDRSLYVIVSTDDGVRLGGAEVRLEYQDGKKIKTIKPRKKIPEHGKYDFGKNVKARSYTIIAEKQWYIPATPKTEFEYKGGIYGAGFTLKSIEVHMYLDLNRDGDLDEEFANSNKWEWGKAGKGAIIFCNNDADGDSEPKTPDNSDNIINGNADEIAKLKIGNVGATPPVNMEATLSVKPVDNKYIRIFEINEQESHQVLGKGMTNEYKLPNINFKECNFGMEATQYADATFDGNIELTLTLKRAGWENKVERCIVRVAPWMMSSHLEKTKRVYVVNWTHTIGNATFRESLKQFTGDGIELDESVEVSGNKIFMQDWMIVGYSSMPGKVIHSILRASADLENAEKCRKFLDRDVGFEAPDFSDKSTHESQFGNIEVTPPCTDSKNKNFPFGRIYYSPGKWGEVIIGQKGPTKIVDAISKKLKLFLKRQVVQEPFEICCSWLEPGHVDEVVTFVPYDSGKYKVLMPSPELALEILWGLPREERSNATMFTQRKKGEEDLQCTVAEFIARDDYNDIFFHNEFARKKINQIESDLKKYINLKPDQLIKVPVLFTIHPSSDSQYVALTANMVNMLVITESEGAKCVFPMPFGPKFKGEDLFQKDLETKLKKINLTPCPIDDWNVYHNGEGEVHCATNSMRKISETNWWEFEPNTNDS